VLALQLRVESMEPETLWLEILGMKWMMNLDQYSDSRE
jgi:hypothetical protein